MFEHFDGMGQDLGRILDRARPCEGGLVSRPWRPAAVARPAARV